MACTMAGIVRRVRKFFRRRIEVAGDVRINKRIRCSLGLLTVVSVGELSVQYATGLGDYKPGGCRKSETVHW